MAVERLECRRRRNVYFRDSDLEERQHGEQIWPIFLAKAPIQEFYRSGIQPGDYDYDLQGRRQRTAYHDFLTHDLHLQPPVSKEKRQGSPLCRSELELHGCAREVVRCCADPR